MLRVNGDIAKLVKLAELTGSLPQLQERLEYLNTWGEEHSWAIMVEMFIGSIDLDRREAEVRVKFYGKHTPTLHITTIKPIMNGGLNLCKVNEDEFDWSVNT